ncbi:helix-turn-helix transcriptional regulator [Kocuria palustris]|uniref:helix-turn-helix transcriptional regulator n=1 Tax=Kocuria palustris TaxID=71999 RepID=UPI0038795050
MRKQVGPRVFDCVAFLIVRDGSVVLTVGERQHPIAFGHAVLIAPRTVFTYEPEGAATLTTLLVDVDYLLDQLYWQHPDVFADRYVVRQYAGALFPDAAHVLHVNGEDANRLILVLDEMTTLYERREYPASYFWLQARLSMLLGTLAPHVRAAPDALPVPVHQRRRSVESPARWREFRPARREALAVEALLRGNIAKRWNLALFCEHVHLSDKQLVRVFEDAYGSTPHRYLTMLRVAELARLLRETEVPVTVAIGRVGWNSRGHAAEIFQRHVGVTPARYRRYGPPTAASVKPQVVV